jgi:hypothetical protein
MGGPRPGPMLLRAVCGDEKDQHECNNRLEWWKWVSACQLCACKHAAAANEYAAGPREFLAPSPVSWGVPAAKESGFETFSTATRLLCCSQDLARGFVRLCRGIPSTACVDYLPTRALSGGVLYPCHPRLKRS